MNNSNKLSIQKLLNYLRDKLSNKERHAFEKEAVKDPFIADAMDGFAQLEPDELAEDLIKLNNKLEQRVGKKRERKLIPYLRIAATVAILMGIATVAFYRFLPEISKKQVADNTNVFEDSIESLKPTVSTKVKENLNILNDKPAAQERINKQQNNKKKQLQTKSASPKQKTIIIDATEDKNQILATSSESLSDSDNILAEIEQIQEPEADETYESAKKAFQTNQPVSQDAVVNYNIQNKKKLNSAVSKEKSRRSNSMESVNITSIKSKYIEINYFAALDKHATPKGGINKLEKCFKQIIREKPQNPTPIIIEFTVENDGSVSEIRILQSPNNELSNMAIQLLKDGPKWEPAKNSGVYIKEKVTLTILYK